ncbi:MAG: hypothetical protein JW822_12885 [Spirochaetales bacterium]|nr:hypothetical protein [Spirochaetales bacterium]
MAPKIDIIKLLPVILGLAGAILMIPGSFVAGNVAYEQIKNYAPGFTAEFYSPEQQNDDIRNLWITVGFVTVVIGLASAILSLWFPHGFGKALILNAVIVAFITVAFNPITLIAIIFLVAGGIVGMVNAPRRE